MTKFGLFGEVFVAGGNDAYVSGFEGLSADAVVAAFCEGTQ